MPTQFFCGVDLAKHHFSLHALDDHGKVMLHKSVSRVKLLNVKSDTYPFSRRRKAEKNRHYCLCA
ncbi:hypothetical protein BZG20_10935 [Salinivibrio sp. IB868]|nr:hypothetical protein BZG20_10935 [Salinivibrio sp. IB868]OOE74497.1 hypothetical protein BZG22_08410 [Salinivibrio sp. IB870]